MSFFPNVEPGFKLSLAPQNLIYFPVNTSTITNITLKLLDKKKNRPISNNKEEVSIRINIKKSNGLNFLKQKVVYKAKKSKKHTQSKLHNKTVDTY